MAGCNNTSNPHLSLHGERTLRRREHDQRASCRRCVGSTWRFARRHGTLDWTPRSLTPRDRSSGRSSAVNWQTRAAANLDQCPAHATSKILLVPPTNCVLSGKSSVSNGQSCFNKARRCLRSSGVGWVLERSMLFSIAATSARVGWAEEICGHRRRPRFGQRVLLGYS